MSHARSSFLGITDSLIAGGFFWGFLFWLIGTIATAVTYQRLPPIVPLFFTQVRGEHQLAPKFFLALLPVFALSSLLFHFYLARTQYHTDRMFARLIALTGSLIALLFFIGLIHILIIVV